MSERAIGASFRDPSGFVYERDGHLYREIKRSYAADYEQLMTSGLYEVLTSKRLLVAHQEVDPPNNGGADHYKTLRPELVPFVSYPYEWCFSELRDAALLTLRLQTIALAHDMTLKDASAYNIQFRSGRPILIDTLSFARYEEGEAWVGYRQFCQHFLAPLALMSRRDVRLLDLMRVHLDGVPLDLAVSLLPASAWLSRGMLMHLLIHARYQKSYEGEGDPNAQGERATSRGKARPLSRAALGNLVEDLRGVVRKLDWQPAGTEWADYTCGDSYAADSLAHKQELVRSHLERTRPRTVWDLGANTGVYSRIAAEVGAQVLSFDVDPACVERSYRSLRDERRVRDKQGVGDETRGSILPLRLDLVNPSPSQGFAHEERSSLAARANADCVLALALIHHLAISNNVPLERIAAYFARLAKVLVIEFVPKNDPKVKILLATREDVFPGYARDGFEAAFRSYYKTLDATAIRGSERVLYLLERLDDTP